MKAATASARVTFKNVLFLTDFSEPSEAALPFAISIARAYGSKMFVLHVLLPNPVLYSTPTSIALIDEAQEDTAKAAMQRVASQLAGLSYDTGLEWGTDVWSSVEHALQAHDIDLIVTGTRGRTGAEKLLLGSVAEEIFRRSPVPVLTVGPAVSKGIHGGARFHNILFATDFSSHSLGALPYALSLAQENQAHLILLHILPYDAKSVSTLNQTALAAALSKMKKLIPEGCDNWCQVGTVVESGEPASRILELAIRHNADLIVLGVRNIAEHLGATTHLGRAIAHKVVADAPCSVLTVRG